MEVLRSVFADAFNSSPGEVAAFAHLSGAFISRPKLARMLMCPLVQNASVPKVLLFRPSRETSKVVQQLLCFLCVVVPKVLLLLFQTPH